jgi:hypothetical protein
VLPNNSLTQRSRSSKFSSVALAMCLTLSLVVPALGQSRTSTCPGKTKPRQWHKYINNQYGFSFWYPEPYKLVPLPPPDAADKYRYHTYFEKRVLLLQRTDNPEAKIWITLDMRPFDLRTLAETHSPTGWDPNWTPVGRKIGSHISYFYGAGGGGADYPDQYFVNLKNKTLQFQFDGPYEGKSPGGETPDLEPEILQTFRVR